MYLDLANCVALTDPFLFLETSCTHIFVGWLPWTNLTILIRIVLLSEFRCVGLYPGAICCVQHLNRSA